MRSFNQSMFIGFVGKDPEITTFEGGKTKASFSIATTESYKHKTGNKVDVTEWHNMIVWGKLAQIVEKYVKRGSCLRITASHKTETWEKADVKHYKSVFVVSSLDFLDVKLSADNEIQEANKDAQKLQETDDLPF